MLLVILLGVSLVFSHPHEEHSQRFSLNSLHKLYQDEVHKSSYHIPKVVDVVSRKSHELKHTNSLFLAPLTGMSPVDFHPQLQVLPKAGDPLVYYSWHIHMYFFHENKNVTTRCLALRTQFMNVFRVPECTGNCFMGGPFDNCTQGICVWEPVYGVDGPHPYGQWGVYLPTELVAQTLSWMSANRGEFEVLFHPNTGLMVGDHDPARRAIWLGDRVPLDLDFLVWLQCKWFGCNDGSTRVNLAHL